MSRPERPPLPSNVLDHLNQNRGGFNEMLGLYFTEATYDRVCCEVPITPALHQPYGLVHGGVYATIIETLASVAAHLQNPEQGAGVVGLENTTSFLRAARSGTLRAEATPLTTGRRTQVWEVSVKSDDGKVAAHGKVRLLCLEPNANVRGAPMKTSKPESAEPQ